jgi:AcrR family transcriptional regulator
VAGALGLFEERGFEGTTIEQIAAAADISRRNFFRYFADKEELFFAEDERLLTVIDETLDSAPDGEPVRPGLLPGRLRALGQRPCPGPAGPGGRELSRPGRPDRLVRHWP